MGILYVTNRRLVLIRDIDPWGEARPMQGRLGIHGAGEKLARLRVLKARGARAYLELTFIPWRLLKAKRHRRQIYLQLATEDGRKFGLGIWMRPENRAMIPYLEGLFRAPPAPPR